MSITGQAFPAIPPDTAAAAGQALDAGSLYHSLAHGMDALFTACRTAAPQEWANMQVATFVQNAVVTLLQLDGPLTDWQAAAASHARLEWKYALHRSLRHPGLKAADLCLFRQQILADAAAWRLFAELAAAVGAQGLWPVHNSEPPALRDRVAGLCRLNLAQWATEAMAQALEGLATWQPEWLRQVAPAHWYTRYGVSGPLNGVSHRAVLPIQDALNDVADLLRLLDGHPRPELAQLPEVRRLRCVSLQPVDPAHTDEARSLRCPDCPLGACIARGCFGASLILQERTQPPHADCACT